MAERATIEPGDDILIVVDVQYDFLPGGALAVPGGDAVIAPINRLVERFPARGADAGLAPARARLLRLEPSGQGALRHDRAALRPAGALAGPLRAGNGRRRDRARASIATRAARHPQGPQRRNRQLFGLQGGRPADPTGLAGYLTRAGASAGLLCRPRPGFLRRLDAPSMRARPGSRPIVVEDAARASMQRLAERPAGSGSGRGRMITSRIVANDHRQGRASPGHPDQRSRRFIIGITGTRPVMTCGVEAAQTTVPCRSYSSELSIFTLTMSPA